ncbi:hypothetical protein F5Y13DRAFT_196959 [Hypoxylon sp. FL1857]|nr:hypothetical protein F5Y13DRAFT_196959 [Hypoxylon sp. FL1857]
MIILKDLLPRAGMIYPSQKDILSRERRDKKVVIALKKAGIIDTGRGVPIKTNKKAVDQALADLFSLVAFPYAMFQLSGEDLNFPKMTQSTASWVKVLPQPTFTELIQRLIDARKAWYKEPREPFETSQHCATALKIDLLLDSVEGQLNSAVSGLFDIIGDYDVKEEDDEEEDGNDDGDDEEMDEDDGEEEEDVGGAGQSNNGGMDVTMTDLTEEEELREGVEAMHIDDDN